MTVRVPSLVLVAGLLVHPMAAQWTAQPGGWFLSNNFSIGHFPDRFSAAAGATQNELHKQDWGLYGAYGLREGFTVGIGQGAARLREDRDGTSRVSRGFGATGIFTMLRLTEGKAGVLSAQLRGDFPILFNRDQRPALGPVKPELELRLLYGTGFGVAGTRGFTSLSVAAAPVRAGDDELRYDMTVGIDLNSRFMLMGQSFNVAAWGSNSGVSYSANKVGGSLLWRVKPGVGIVGGYYRGVAGRNTAREESLSLGLWLSRNPQQQAPPPTPPTGSGSNHP